jgi:hypothetical protein
MYRNNLTIFQVIMKLMLFLPESILLTKIIKKNLLNLNQTMSLTRRLYKRK